MLVLAKHGNCRSGAGAAMNARVVCVLTIVAGLSACGSTETCEEPEFYESAVAGRRIEAPDDLSNLAAQKELKIPEASPRPPRDRSAGCLDRPPTLRTEET